MNIGYKLFEMDMRNGKLYPLFIGKTEETKVGEWVHAEFIPTKGFAVRSGWHLGLIPSAPHLIGADGTYRSKRGKNFKRVWCEVEYNNTHNYTSEAYKQPKHCFVCIPDNGYYDFKEPNGAKWIISSDIRVKHILTDGERSAILLANKFDEAVAIGNRVEILNRRK